MKVTTRTSTTAPEGEPAPLGATSELIRELLLVSRHLHETNQQDRQPPTTPEGKIDNHVLGRQLLHSMWHTYFQLLLGQAMIDHGLTQDSSFPFITKVITTVGPGGEKPTVKTVPTRAYTKASRLVRERRKWYAQLKRFYTQPPTVDDAQAMTEDVTFSPELRTVLETDIAGLTTSALGRGRNR